MRFGHSLNCMGAHFSMSRRYTASEQRTPMGMANCMGFDCSHPHGLRSHILSSVAAAIFVIILIPFKACVKASALPVCLK